MNPYKPVDQSKKVLLIGDYSNCHRNLAEGLIHKGHEVTLLRNDQFSRFDENDIFLERRSGKIGGIQFLINALTKWQKYLKGFDIVAFNDPNFFVLHPYFLKPVFKRIKEDNGKVFYTAMSIDTNYIEMCESKESPLRYNEYFIDGKPSPWNLENPARLNGWKKPAIKKYQDYFFSQIDGAVSVLYEYHLGLLRRFRSNEITYGGIPVPVKDIPFIGPVLKNKIRILLCRDSRRIKFKGSDLLETSVNNIITKYPEEVEIRIAENLSYDKFIEEIKRSDIVLDQVYSYTPATTALIAMGMGKTVVSGGEEDYYEFINESNNKPIINASLDIIELTASMENLIFDKEFLKDNSLKSREFVEKHNSSEIVAERFMNLWTRNDK